MGDIGLLDYGARFYDPSIARFTIVDPLSETYTFQNPFAYAANNPIKFIDYMGLGATYNWDEHVKGNKGVYNDDNGNEVSWSDVKKEYGIDKRTNDAFFLSNSKGVYFQQGDISLSGSIKKLR